MGNNDGTLQSLENRCLSMFKFNRFISFISCCFFSIIFMLIAYNCNQVTPSTKSNEADIVSFTIPGNQTNLITGTNISILFSNNINRTSLTPTITLSPGAWVSPPSGVAQNFTNPITYTVTAEDGVTTKTYIASINVNTPFAITFITSPNFTNGAQMPNAHLYPGLTSPISSSSNLSPALSWTTSGTAPEGLSYILFVHDSLPVAGNWVHWILSGIPKSFTNLPQGIRSYTNSNMTSVTVNGQTLNQYSNSYEHIGYFGPFTSAPTGTHRYHFTLYAVTNSFTAPTYNNNSSVYYVNVSNAINRAGVIDQIEYIGINVR